MLVLSRRETEKVLFPTLGISIEVLRTRGNTARLGITAPPNVPVLRHEIAGTKLFELTPGKEDASERLRELAHCVRRRLDEATATLNQLHADLDDSENDRGQVTILRLFRELQQLEHEANLVLDGTDAARALRVLVVEDSAFERALLAGALELSGLNVTTANDGQDALDYLSLHSLPNAVLLDMIMPRVDGPEFVREVRANPEFAGLKIYAVSGTEPAKLGLVTGIGGIDGWFPKPLNPGELVSVLTRQFSQQLVA